MGRGDNSPEQRRAALIKRLRLKSLFLGYAAYAASIYAVEGKQAGKSGVGASQPDGYATSGLVVEADGGGSYLEKAKTCKEKKAEIAKVNSQITELQTQRKFIQLQDCQADLTLLRVSTPHRDNNNLIGVDAAIPDGNGGEKNLPAKYYARPDGATSDEEWRKHAVREYFAEYLPDVDYDLLKEELVEGMKLNRNQAANYPIHLTPKN